MGGVVARMIQLGQASETWALALDPNASTGGVRLRDVLESAEGAPEERLRVLRARREEYERRLAHLTEDRRAAGELALRRVEERIAALAERRQPAGEDIVECEGSSLAAPPTVRETMSEGTSATRGQFGERPAETPEGQGFTADSEAEGDHASPGGGDQTGPGDVTRDPEGGRARLEIPAGPSRSSESGNQQRPAVKEKPTPRPPRKVDRLWRILAQGTRAETSSAQEGND